jgi:hypothetical protein
MDDKPHYLTGYVVIRIDDGPLDHPSSVRKFTINGVALPAPGPSNVSVKEVVTTAVEACREVIRLNALNSGKGCQYFWQTTHIFLDGGSHGSSGRAASESKRQAEPGAADVI